MFVVMTARGLLIPSGVKCSDLLSRAQGTPDGVRALAASVAIDMALSPRGEKSKLAEIDTHPCGCVSFSLDKRIGGFEWHR
jgi:hypothetical protein